MLVGGQVRTGSLRAQAFFLVRLQEEGRRLLCRGSDPSCRYDERVSGAVDFYQPGAAPTRHPLPDPYTPGHGTEDFDVTHYDLHLDYQVATNRLNGHASLSARATVTLTSIMLNLTGLRVLKARVNGSRPARFTQREGRIVITSAQPIPAGSTFTVDVRYEGRPGPLRGNWGDVGWEELTDGVLVAGQPTGAPSWFPCNDHPSRKASFGFTVTTETNYGVVCNGTLVAKHSKASRQTWVYEQAEPMATYLATVQIGRYRIEPLTAPGPQGGPALTAVPAPAQYLAAPPALIPLARAALSAQQHMMVTFAGLFGPYPFPGYTVVVTDDELEIPLEAQSLSIIGRNHLDQSWNSQRLIAHELAHQWFGNCLTASRWQDIWLHEGFACYAEWLWSEASGQGGAGAHAAEALRGLAAKPQDVIIGDPGPELMFDDRVYKRGALALHALRTALGDDRFFSFLKAWVDQNRFGSVCTSRLSALAQTFGEGIGGFDADAVLAAWLYRKALPVTGQHTNTAVS
jgi:aminopeptidase N